jgi:thymidylate kinase
MPDKFIVIDANRPIEKVATAVQDIFLVGKEL